MHIEKVRTLCAFRFLRSVHRITKSLTLQHMHTLDGQASCAEHALTMLTMYNTIC